MSLLNRPPTPDLPAGASLSVYLAGTVDFSAAQFFQERLADELADRSDLSGAILLCEHPPTVTIGREGSGADLLGEQTDFLAAQSEIHWVNRGGGTWLTGPGQLVAYVVLPIDRLGIRPLELRNALQAGVLGMAAEQRVPAWVEPLSSRVTCRCGQFAFVGAAVREGISQFGLCVNVAPAWEALQLVRWGPAPLRVTSLSAQRLRPLTIPSIRESLIRRLAAELGFARYHLSTGHRLLRRTPRSIHVAS